MILFGGGAILLVIIGHSGCPNSVYNLIYSFHMPLFFVISGYLFNFEKWSTLGYRALIQNRFVSYIKPYIILSGVNYAICLAEELIKNGITLETISLMKRWLFGIMYVYPSVDYMPNCTPLWFLVALFLASVLLFPLLKIKNMYTQIVMAAFVAFIDACIYYYCDFQLPWCLGAVLIGICCMYFGYQIRNTEILPCKLTICLPLIGIGLMSAYINGKVGIGANNLGHNPMLFWLSALSLSFVCIAIVSRTKMKTNLFSWFGKNTILFMGFNYFFNDFSQTIWIRIPFINQFQYTWYMKSIACVFFISLLIVLWNAIKKKYPKLARFTGF